MFIALNEKNNRITAETAEKGVSYFCPVCKGEVIVKNGKYKCPHFAHKANECTDDWNYDMSEWHKHKQNFFDEKYQEVVLTSNGKTHRADVLINNIVIEFQHSPISSKEFNERNSFYTSLGYKVAWVFDVTDQVDNEKLQVNTDNNEYIDSRDNRPDNRIFLRWKNPKQVLREVVPMDCDNNIVIWLCWDNAFIKKSSSCNYPDSDEKEFSIYNNPSIENEKALCGDFLHKVIWSSCKNAKVPDYKYIMLSSFPLYMGKNFNAEQLFYSKRDCILKLMEEEPPYTIKHCYIIGKPKDTYICPKTNKFGLNLIDCRYCPYCRLIEKSDSYGYYIYCKYPNIVKSAIIIEPEKIRKNPASII